MSNSKANFELTKIGKKKYLKSRLENPGFLENEKLLKKEFPNNRNFFIHSRTENFNSILLYETIVDRDLHTALEKETFNYKTAGKVLRDITEGLLDIHSIEKAYLGVREENIYLQKSKAFLADFSGMKDYSLKTTEVKEVFASFEDESPVVDGRTVDMLMLGYLLVKIISKKKCLEKERTNMGRRRISYGDQVTNKGFKYILDRLLQINSNSRATAEEVLLYLSDKSMKNFKRNIYSKNNIFFILKPREISDLFSILISDINQKNYRLVSNYLVFKISMNPGVLDELKAFINIEKTSEEAAIKIICLVYKLLIYSEDFDISKSSFKGIMVKLQSLGDRAGRLLPSLINCVQSLSDIIASKKTFQEINNPSQQGNNYIHGYIKALYELLNNITQASASCFRDDIRFVAEEEFLNIRQNFTNHLIINFKSKPEMAEALYILAASDNNSGPAELPGLCEIEIPLINPNDIKDLDIFAGGSTSSVKKGYFNNVKIAVKSLPIFTDTEKLFLREVETLSKLEHENVAKLIGIYQSIENKFSYYNLVSPFYSDNLKDFLYSSFGKNILTNYDRVLIANSIANGMAFIHTRNIIHRDLKPENIFLEKPVLKKGDKISVKIGDFGCARVMDNGGLTCCVGTTYWMAPEVVDQRNYTTHADIFSFGIVLWEIFSGKEPYYDQVKGTVSLDRIKAGLRPRIKDVTNGDIRDLIKKCWHKYPEKRESFTEIQMSLSLILKKMKND